MFSFAHWMLAEMSYGHAAPMSVASSLTSRPRSRKAFHSAALNSLNSLMLSPRLNQAPSLPAISSFVSV